MQFPEHGPVGPVADNHFQPTGPGNFRMNTGQNHLLDRLDRLDRYIHTHTCIRDFHVSRHAHVRTYVTVILSGPTGPTCPGG